jgi:hypothetical protein
VLPDDVSSTVDSGVPELIYLTTVVRKIALLALVEQDSLPSIKMIEGCLESL